ncbi:hypothetical protein I4U23_015396 [Adineta vaga]|nr:hypothetical protein I4U23_015396 [Adineta vaga]
MNTLENGYELQTLDASTHGLSEVDSVDHDSTTIQSTTKQSTTSAKTMFVIGLVLGLLVAGNVLAVVVVLWQRSGTDSTTASINLMTSTTINFTSTTTKSTTATTSTTTATTTTAPPSSVCVYNNSIYFYNDEFIYSPTSQTYAVGMLNNQFGVYSAYSYGNVTSTTLWTANQISTSISCFLALQYDRNLVVYALGTMQVLWTAAIYNNGSGTPFCFEILDSGNLIWTDKTKSIVWQTNTTQSG